MGDNDDQQRDNARLMLPLHHKRNNQLANMLIQLNGFIIAVIAGLNAFVGSSVSPNPNCSACHWSIILTINITIIVMILWRIYSNYIDDDIQRGYLKILNSEKVLQIADESSLLVSLAKVCSVPFSEKGKEEIYQKVIKKIENSEYIPRDHLILDTFAYILSLILLIVELIVINPDTYLWAISAIAYSIVFFCFFQVFVKDYRKNQFYLTTGRCTFL